MNTIEALEARRSVRGYLDKPVEEEKLAELLKVANKAPIAGTIFLSVVTNRELLEEINGTGKQAAMDSGNDFLISRVTLPGYRLTYGAPALVVLSAPPEGYSAINTACAAENLCIAATDLGLGSCFLVGFLLAFQKNPDLLGKLQIPEGYAPQCGVILGYEGESAIPTVPRPDAGSNIAYIR